MYVLIDFRLRLSDRIFSFFVLFYGTPCSLLSQQGGYNIGILEVGRCYYILLLSRILFKMEGYFN